jgi:hypothetical protein
MELLFDLMIRYVWAVGILLILLTYFDRLRKIRSSATASAASREDARQYLQRYTLASALVCLIMGFGMVVGGVELKRYFYPLEDNPYVVTWFATSFVLVILNSVWILFAGGARKVREHELLTAFRFHLPQTELTIKILAALAPFWFIVWLYLGFRGGKP